MTIQTLPASTPAPKSPDEQSHPSRKRQRSQSMQSDASSSSLKRPLADGNSYDGIVRSPRADQMSTLTLTESNQDIDAYMAEQGEDDIPALTSITASPRQSAHGFQLLPPAEKLAVVERGKNRKMEAGDTWYLVSRDWWKRWRKACTGEIDKEGPVSEQDIGPVDNSRLLDSYGNLQSSLAEGVDLEFVPEDVWKLFFDWYGEAIHPLPRRVIQRGTSKQTSLELRPPTLKVFRLVKDSSGGPCCHTITISSGETIKALNEQLATAVALDPEDRVPYRVWKIEPVEDDWPALELPSSMLSSLNGKILEDSDQTIEGADIQSDDCFVVEFKLDNAWIADASITTSAPPITFAGNPGVPAPLFNSNDGFFNRMGKTTTSSVSTSSMKANGYYNSLTPSWKTPITQKERAVEPGTLGLGNLGNTCFMNSALQCLAHNKELTDYFLTGLYREELNPDNPLGMHGAIAEAFGALLQKIWAPTGSSTSYTPREFKSQLQRFAPQFSGYQQQDSQELVAFLLDGLHEDLNRVLKKPYVEKPDWEDGGDLELVKLAQKSWDGYMKRNDSVIVDLFQGQYQSTLVCPECQKVSITFDPFMYLTLPLPVQNKWMHTIFYVPWGLEKPHFKVPVEINRDASFKDLRTLLGRWMGAPPDNLLTLEIFNNRFFKNLDDSLVCGDMADNDLIVCFELPCHAQQSKTYKKQAGDPMIVPVYLCDANPPLRPSYTSNKGGSLFGYPFVVAITPEQATDVNVMYDVVLTRLQRWTANSRDLFAWEEGPMSDVMDEVPIRLNGFSPVDSITEIKENGEVVEVESDIIDEQGMRMDEDMDTSPPEYVPQRVGTKKDVFTLRLQVNHKEFGTQYTNYSAANRWESWDRRVDQADTHPVLLREGDGFFCEFDENMKAYYFGDERSRWEHALWDSWELFNHSEYAESKRAGADRKNKVISLQDCLDEFTKEEKLGEDDLWYCPQCKKHQQATKKFDLWKVPDVLVVHLKRFSNSRTLRDKIETFIDFPVEGLDLGGMVGERAVAKKLAEQGLNLEELQLGDLDEPLVYDLFGVDEHIGGLGSGHYRAYALNHVTEKWYHFDDSFVESARATDAVTANAYLLFYRRRSPTPLGGKTHHKIEAARSKPETTADDDMKIDTQLRTPPREDGGYMTGLAIRPVPGDPWTLRSHGSNAGSSTASPSPDGLPPLEDSPANALFVESLDPLLIASQRFDFPDPSGKVSPTSSNEAEADPDTDIDIDWEDGVPSYEVGVNEVVPGNSPEGQSGIGSPSSSISDMSPFSDVTSQSYKSC